MLRRRQRFGRHERLGQRRVVSERIAECPMSEILDRFLFRRLAVAQDAPPEDEIEYRFDAARHVAGQQRDRSGRCDRRQATVANTVRRNRIANVFIEPRDIGPSQECLGIVKRKRPLLGGKSSAGAIGGVLDERHPLRSLFARGGAAIRKTEENQRVGKPRDAETDAPLGARLPRLRLKRIPRNVDDVVEKTDGGRDARFEFRNVDMRRRRERLLDEPRQIDRSQKARAIRRQRLLPAGVRRRNRLAIIEIVGGVDAIDENDARLGIVVGRAHDLVPQRARLDRLVDLAGKYEIPRRVAADGVHEGIGYQHRKVEISEPLRIRFRRDERFDIRVIAPERRHHGAAPLSGRHDRPAHRVPDVHEADRTRCIRADALDRRAPRPKRREIMADAAAGLHRQRRFFDAVEDARKVVGNFAQDEAVEERHRAFGSGSCQYPASRLKAEVGHGVVKRVRPLLLLALAALFDGRRSRGDTAERILKRLIRRNARANRQSDTYDARWHRKSRAMLRALRSSAARDIWVLDTPKSIMFTICSRRGNVKRFPCSVISPVSTSGIE